MKPTEMLSDNFESQTTNSQAHLQPDGHASNVPLSGSSLDLSTLRHQCKDQFHETLLHLSQQGHEYVKNGDSMIVYLNNPSARSTKIRMESIGDGAEDFSTMDKDLGDTVLQTYHPSHCEGHIPLPTHLYGLLATVMRRVADGEKQQVIFNAGISGAGKTYTSEITLKFLLHQSGNSPNDSELKLKVAAALSILASLCNASTPLNGESSRASVIATALFERNTCRPLGVSFSIMAWERSRVMLPCDEYPGHSNFLFLEGLAAWGYENQEMAAKLKLDGKFPITPHEIGSSGWRKACDLFQSYHQALSTMFSPNEVIDILKVSAGILHLSRANTSVQSPKRSASLRIASELVKIPVEALDAAMDVGTGHSDDRLPTMCDKVGQSLAHQLLKRVLAGINRSISADVQNGDHCRVMIVDQAGFEEFSKNELAQFGVNMINEHFQHCLHIYLTQINLPLSERSGEAYASSSAADTSSLSATNALESDVFQATCASIANSKAADIKIEGIGEEEQITLKHFAGDVTYDTSKFIKQNICIRTEEVIRLVARSALDIWKLNKESREEKTFTSEDLAWDFALSRAASVQDFVEELFRCSDRCYFIRCFLITREDSGDIAADDVLIKDQIRTSGLAAAVRFVPVYEDTYSPEQIASKFPAIFSAASSMEIEAIRSALFNFVLSQKHLHIMDFQIDGHQICLNERMTKAMHRSQEKICVADFEDVTKSAMSDWDETSDCDPDDSRIGEYSMMVDDKDAFLTLGVKLEAAIAKQSEQFQSIRSMELERLCVLEELSAANRKTEDLQALATNLESRLNQMTSTVSEERSNVSLKIKEKDREVQDLIEVIKRRDEEIKISASDINRNQLALTSLQRELHSVEAESHAKSITTEASQKDLRHALGLVEAESALVQQSKGKINHLLIGRTRAEEAGAAYVISSISIVTYNKADLNACIKRQKTALQYWYISLSDRKGKPIRVVLSGLRNFVKTGSLINQVLPTIAVLEGWQGMIDVLEEGTGLSEDDYVRSQITVIIQDARDRCTAELPKILFRTSTVSGGKIRRERLDPSALVNDRRMWDKAGNLAAEDVMRTLEDVWAYIHPIRDAIALLHPAMSNYLQQIYVCRKSFPVLKISILASKIRVLSTNFGEEYKSAAGEWASILAGGVDCQAQRAE